MMLRFGAYGGRDLGFRGNGPSARPPEIPAVPPVLPPTTATRYDPPPPTGQTFRVANDTQLDSALNNASQGDEIVLTGSTYSKSRAIRNRGVVIRSNFLLSAEVKGRWNLYGNGLFVHGIEFTGLEKWVGIRANDIQVSRCKFHENYQPPQDRPRLIDVRGRRAKITACEFTDFIGTAIYFRIIGGDNGYDGLVERCWFHDIASTSGGAIVACETDGTSLWIDPDNDESKLRYLNATVQYNLFERVRVNVTAPGQPKNKNREMLMSKSNGNKIRYNTVIDCDGYINSRFTLYTLFECNWVERSFGMLFQGDGNIALNNYVKDAKKDKGFWILGGRCTMDNIRYYKKKTVTPKNKRGLWYHPAVRKSVFAWNTTVDTDFIIGRPNQKQYDTYEATDIRIEGHTGRRTWGSLADKPNIVVTTNSNYERVQPIKLSASDVGPNYRFAA